MSAATGARIAFAVLALATVGAFFAASRLKAEPGVVHKVKRTRFFSPDGDGRRDTARISFQLKRRDRVTVDIVDVDSERVRRIAEGLRAGREERVTFEWDGLTDGRNVAPDGGYRVRVGLRREGRAVIPPRTIYLDTKPPTPAAIVTSSPVTAPGRPVRFRVRGAGRAATPSFRVVRTDVSPQRTVASFEGTKGQHRATWDARLENGEPAPPGTYVIAVSARDRAGNLGTGQRLPARPGPREGRPGVTIRALAVQPPVRPVRAGALVSFRIDSRGRPYRWQVRRVGARRPVKRNRRPNTDTTIAIRAPRGISGLYLLEVRSGRWSTRVPLAVQAERRRRLLVVLPMISWLGRDPVDEPHAPDGVPDTLANGSIVDYPRLFAYPGGLPADLVERVAPLLVHLDRARIRYDLTTDLELALSEDPFAGDHTGVLFAGSPEWVTRGLGRRLRAYVEEGGHVALFGPGALRAGVTVGDRKLTRPTPPGPADALGARIADVRDVARGADGAPLPLTVLVEEGDSGLLEGFAGRFDGFARVEELVTPGERATVEVSVGEPLSDAEVLEAERADRLPREERPALSAVASGEGSVIRVGLPDWVERLEAGDLAVTQITRNITDILRGIRPRPLGAG